MNLTRRDVTIAVFVAFVAWGLLTRRVPVLRYLGYSFVIGVCVAIIAIGALLVLSSRNKSDVEQWANRRRRTVAFMAPEAWKTETAWLNEKAVYKKEPLYPASFLISDAIDGLLHGVLQDVVSTWYNKITRSPKFVNEIDRAVRTALISVRDRMFRVDIVEVAVSRIVPVVTNHLKDFHEAEKIIRGKHLNRNVTESEELDLAIAAKYRNGQLHSAASLSFSDLKMVQQEYLRKIVVRLMPEILPESMMKSRAVSVLIKEIVACAVLAPVMQILSDPDTWNQVMEIYGRTMLQDRKSVRRLRAALDEHASPVPSSLRMLAFPRLSPQDDERKFERFIRAIRKCQNLSEARRFRSEVASQLKRESLNDSHDQIYMRRLETGKYLLDQRVARLSTVGGQNGNRVPKPDSKNGANGSGPSDSSIIDVLHDATGLSYFMEYMDRHRRMSLVQFWVVVDGFRNPLDSDFPERDDQSLPEWTESDRLDLAQIYETYLSRPELKVSEASPETVRTFLKAGQSATPSQYLQAKTAVLKTQGNVLEEMQEEHFPNFKRSDLYYKYLTADDASGRATLRNKTRASKFPSIASIPESPSKPPPISRVSSIASTSDPKFMRNAASHGDLKSSLNHNGAATPSYQRRSFDIDTSKPLFDDDIDTEPLARSIQPLDGDPTMGEIGGASQERMVEAMEAALTDIMAGDNKDDDNKNGLFQSPTTNSVPNHFDSDQSSVDQSKLDDAFSEKSKEKPNLASLGLVNTSSRIGVFTDDDLFGDEEKFIEDEHVDPEEFVDDKELHEDIHEAAPGDLGLAEAITVLTTDIDRLISQESIVDTLTRKAQLTNNVAELRILNKSKSSLQREIRRKELQRQQYIVQESDNSLYGRANIEIKQVIVEKEDDGQEYVLYVIDVRRKAGEDMSSASWVIARRYSEFHNLHARLRSNYPAVRLLDFPKRNPVLKLQREFLYRRRVSLERYLRELLRLPAVCRSRDLRAFLSQQAIISTTSPNLSSSKRDIVSRIYNSVTDGMDEFLGNVPVLDQLSIAGQNLISAATSQFNTPPSSTSPTSFTSTPAPSTLEARTELSAFEDKDLEPFVKPICDLFLETFELNRGNNWLRGRAVVIVLHQLLGGTVERKVRETLKSLTREDAILSYLATVSDLLFSDGQLRRERNIRTEAEKAASRREASVMLATLIPDMAGSVVGRGNAQLASRKVFATLNNRRLNSHLVFSVLDEVVRALFPDGRR